jgi:hypothetical protein
MPTLNEAGIAVPAGLASHHAILRDTNAGSCVYFGCESVKHSLEIVRLWIRLMQQAQRLQRPKNLGVAQP